MDGVTQLYRHYDKKGCLLYIGVSNKPIERIKHHKTHAAWYKYLHKTTLEEYQTRKKALVAERAAIKKENPKYNVAHTDKHKVRYDNVSAILPNQPKTVKELKDLVDRFYRLYDTELDFHVIHKWESNRELTISNYGRVEDVNKIDYLSGKRAYRVKGLWYKLLPEITFFCYVSNSKLKPTKEDCDKIVKIVDFDYGEKMHISESGERFLFAALCKRLNKHIYIN